MNETCTYAEDEDGVWDTECGHRFETVEGGPHDNDMLYCCFCGRPLVESVRVGSDYDEEEPE